MKNKLRIMLIEAFKKGICVNFGFNDGVAKVWRRVARSHGQFDRYGRLRKTLKATRRWENSGKYVFARKLANYLVASGQVDRAIKEINMAMESGKDINEYLHLD